MRLAGLERFERLLALGNVLDKAHHLQRARGAGAVDLEPAEMAVRPGVAELVPRAHYAARDDGAAARLQEMPVLRVNEGQERCGGSFVVAGVKPQQRIEAVIPPEAFAGLPTP